jgi:carboxy-terminal domain RNA polymerase II polypeptide A small phosphatase
LGRIGRDLKNIIIIDNSAASYLFHPENAIPIESWFDDPNDRDLMELVPFLKDLAKAPDVRTLIRQQYNVQ